MSKQEKGLYKKYIVRRSDGSSEAGGKHYGCQYFVLDVDHDPHAYRALVAYAASCSKDFPALAADLREMASVMRQKGVVPKAGTLEDLQKIISEGRAFVSDGKEMDRWIGSQDMPD